jgi:hypothetical protein
LRPNDPLARGSEARATFCSAKGLEDVKTTGKMKNMMQGWCTEPVSNPVLILGQQAIEASPLRLENEKTTGRALPVVLEVHCEVGIISSRQGAKPSLVGYSQCNIHSKIN